MVATSTGKWEFSQVKSGGDMKCMQLRGITYNLLYTGSYLRVSTW